MSRRRLISVSVGLIGLAASFFLWHFVIRDRVVVKRWGEVVQGKAFRSGQISRHLIRHTLESHGIRRVICLTSPDVSDLNQQAEVQVSSELGIEHVFLPLNGRGGGNVQHFTRAVDLFTASAQKAEPVLVHCHAGAQRTGGVIAAYRLLVERRSTDEVLVELAKYGWNARRDQYLIQYLNEHLDDAARVLVAEGRIDRVPNPIPRLPLNAL